MNIHVPCRVYIVRNLCVEAKTADDKWWNIYFCHFHSHLTISTTLGQLWEREENFLDHKKNVMILASGHVVVKDVKKKWKNKLFLDEIEKLLSLSTWKLMQFIFIFFFMFERNWFLQFSVTHKFYMCSIHLRPKSAACCCNFIQQRSKNFFTYKIC